MFTWRERPEGFAGWNTRFAGTTAGSLKTEGYVYVKLRNKCYLAHRLAWLHIHGQWPTEDIDHINSVRSDNRLSNLREAPGAINHQNKKHGWGSSRYLGVFWNSSRQKWRAQLRLDRKAYFLGYFDTEAEAHAAYLAAKRRLHPGYVEAVA